jgi:hypothetical protein
MHAPIQSDIHDCIHDIIISKFHIVGASVDGYGQFHT